MAAFKGYRRGLILALFSFIAFIIGLAAALKLSAVVANWLHANTNINAQWLPFLSFILVMIGVSLLVRWCALVIQKTLELAMLGMFNKLLGILFYAALYIIIYSVVLFYATRMQLFKQETIAASKSYSFIEPLGPKLINAIGSVIPVFKNLFIQLENFFSSVAQKATAP